MKFCKQLYLSLILILSLSGLGITVTQRAFDTDTSGKEQSSQNENLNANNDEYKNDLSQKEKNCIAQVVKIISDFEEELPGGNKQRSQQLLLKLLTGINKNKERVALNVIPDNPAFSITGEVGKKYLVAEIDNGEKNDMEDYFLIDYYREPYIWYLTASFLLLLIIIGGLKGIRTIISLLITVALIAFLLIPSIIKGVNPLLSAIVISFLSTAITMVFVAGLNFKSMASTLGTVIGVSISGVIATLVIKTASLTGLASSEAMILWGNQSYQLNFKGLLAAGMIVSCLGAIMDVSISIASAIQEIKIANPNYLLKDLFNSGMNVGKDIMGTMTSTLVLAYTGMALPLLLLISHEKNPAKFLNLELVVSEITAAVAGSIGLIIAVPATALIMSWLIQKKTS